MEKTMDMYQQLADQKRRYADRADYLLEQFGRTIDFAIYAADEKEKALEGLLHNIGIVAMDSDYIQGQSIMNRAFYIARSSGHEELAKKVEREAIDCDFSSPAAAPL